MTDSTRPGLGRLFSVDDRDRQFLLADHPEAIQVTQVLSHLWTLRSGLVMDQGQTGTCVGHGWKARLMSAPLQQGHPSDPPTAFGIYDLAIAVDEWANNDNDTERQMGTSVRAGAKVLQKLGYIPEYRWAYTADDAAKWIGGASAHGTPVGGPLVIGVNWYSSMFEPDAEGFIRITPGAQIEGGHCVCVLGYDRERGAFEAVNSWGNEWGHRGHFFLDGETMARLLAEQGEACAPTESWVR